jgi:NADH dehydrogenase FAD-containing subunit
MINRGKHSPNLRPSQRQQADLPDHSVSGYPEIFAIGDTAHVVAPFRNLIGISTF